jgi:hypothetical protein
MLYTYMGRVQPTDFARTKRWPREDVRPTSTEGPPTGEAETVLR